MPEVVWKQGAENDLLEIFGNLEEQKEDSGERFVERLDFTLAHVRQHPEMAPIFEPPVRRLVIGSTGFGLFYSVESRGIIAHARVHLARNPETIRARVRRLFGFN
jgi:plasmid stabilization system protein ParE